MKPTPPVKNLLDKPMSRKDFLKIAGFGALSVFGANNIVALLMSNKQPTPPRPAVNQNTAQSNSSFGSRKFGV